MSTQQSRSSRISPRSPRAPRTISHTAKGIGTVVTPAGTTKPVSIIKTEPINSESGGGVTIITSSAKELLSNDMDSALDRPLSPSIDDEIVISNTTDIPPIVTEIPERITLSRRSAPAYSRTSQRNTPLVTSIKSAESQLIPSIPFSSRMSPRSSRMSPRSNGVSKVSFSEKMNTSSDLLEPLNSRQLIDGELSNKMAQLSNRRNRLPSRKTVPGNEWLSRRESGLSNKLAVPSIMPTRSNGSIGTMLHTSNPLTSIGNIGGRADAVITSPEGNFVPTTLDTGERIMFSVPPDSFINNIDMVEPYESTPLPMMENTVTEITNIAEKGSEFAVVCNDAFCAFTKNKLSSIARIGAGHPEDAGVPLPLIDICTLNKNNQYENRTFISEKSGNLRLLTLDHNLSISKSLEEHCSCITQKLENVSYKWSHNYGPAVDNVTSLISNFNEERYLDPSVCASIGTEFQLKIDIIRSYLNMYTTMIPLVKKKFSNIEKYFSMIDNEIDELISEIDMTVESMDEKFYEYKNIETADMCY